MYHTIVVTGGAGFIGSNFIHHIIKKHGDSIQVVNLDKLTYAGNLENLKDVENLPNYHFVNADICDGEAQGHDGINYSLPSRDMMANMIEIHANATPFDGGVFIASCDKGMPAHLMAVGRINIPSIIVTGGVMDAGPDLLTLEQIGKYNAMCERGEITKEKMEFYKHNACPSCGACSFMGTASTMQVMAEALGLMLPGSALMPATSKDLRAVSYTHLQTSLLH